MTTTTFTESLEHVACPHCGAEVGGYRDTIRNETPPQGPLYPHIHQCPGDEMQVAPGIQQGVYPLDTSTSPAIAKAAP